MTDLSKYNIPVPRYTSYPTVPFWDAEAFKVELFEKTLQLAFWESSKEVSIYIHLPFCESLCTYCACNTRITRNHSVEQPYINYLLKEWSMYLDRLPNKPIIREIHLGGGTPTFFSANNLKKLLIRIQNTAILSNEFQMSFEGHPGNTTPEHLQTLFDLGFDRVSFGIQDFDLNVQRLINRMQSFEQVKFITEKARAIGYTSINYDMVYGLPGQTQQSVQDTLQQVIELKPERIAYYSYAHVPATRPAQQSYEHHLPSEVDKLAFMEMGKTFFIGVGYEEVGMDHFVLPGDELLEARKNGELHRNFMGYTPFTSKLLIGLGASAISDTWLGFAQNEKSVEGYYKLIDEDRLPIISGHVLTDQDLFFRKHILNLMCDFKTSWIEEEFLRYGMLFNYHLIEQLQSDGLIDFSESGIEVKDQGRQIIRVICSTLDARLDAHRKFTGFSQAI